MIFLGVAPAAGPIWGVLYHLWVVEGGPPPGFLSTRRECFDFVLTHFLKVFYPSIAFPFAPFVVLSSDRDGEMFLLDTTFIHEAVNESNEDRYVLPSALLGRGPRTTPQARDIAPSRWGLGPRLPNALLC